jgi:hypothetical protein
MGLDRGEDGGCAFDGGVEEISHVIFHVHHEGAGCVDNLGIISFAKFL